MQEKNIAKFAEEIGVNRRQIDKKIKEGVLDKSRRGHIKYNQKAKNYETSRKGYIGDKQPIKKTTNKSQKNKERPKKINKEIDVDSLFGEELAEEHNKAKTKTAITQSKIKELEYLELKGKLVDKKVIMMVMEEAIIILNNNLGIELRTQIRQIVKNVVQDDKIVKLIEEQIMSLIDSILDNFSVNLSKN